MKNSRLEPALLDAISLFALCAEIVQPQVKATRSTVHVHMVVTDQESCENNDPPVLRPDNVQVKQGNKALKVNHVIPALGDKTKLHLFILFDDILNSRIETKLSDIRDFINNRPASTQVGMSYTSDATFQVAQNFSVDRALASKSLCVLRGRLSAMDSPYLSLIALLMCWPQEKVRREILLVSGGIDHLRSNGSNRARSMSGMSPDVDSASAASQRNGVIVYSI